MTDIDKLIEILNASCERYGKMPWNKETLLDGSHRCGLFESTCRFCKDHLKKTLRIQMEKDERFVEACDNCKNLCIDRVTERDYNTGNTLFNTDKYVADRMSCFRYCHNCKINMTIRNAKLKLKQPNVNIADVLSDCLDIFKQLSDQINRK